jgi:rubrerythrin
MVTPSLLDAIRVAKDNERIASESYRDAVQEIQHTVGKRLFQELSDFEQFHLEKLTALEKSLIETGKFINYEGKEFPLPPIFEVKGAVEPGKKSLMTIITQAIGLEETAKKTYAELADEIDDPLGKEMFKKLSAEEYGHYKVLVEAYWTVSNFGVWKWVRP